VARRDLPNKERDLQKECALLQKFYGPFVRKKLMCFGAFWDYFE